ncbi:hypothetical protein QQS21_009575 [Conoideocrella luteorostrata]|uniref:Beta-lactamase-related domain-containing protein n=1 Tax=Conoideocrella luteorostrata TaxID=1105319 RepID=A0AAJ0CJC9_9HYPO|nr:hypothetical protein QQS21_009575 [Conoideocrella luteorostrata]
MQLQIPRGAANGDGQTPFTGDFETFVDHVLQHFHVPSVSIGIVDGDKTHLKCFGNAKVSGEEATEDTLYLLASVTKSFTATTLLSVLEEQNGKDGQPDIGLNAKISSIIPDDFVLQDEYATRHATLQDALCHVLGVASAEGCYGGEGYTLSEAIRSLRHLPMSGELREKHEYLNMGYMTIQHVVEKLTGKPIEKSHARCIWDPLGMTSTFASLDEARNADNTLATGYTWDPILERLIEAPYSKDYPLIGGGGLTSSIKDLTGYLRAVVHGSLPLHPSWQKELIKPRTIASESNDPNRSTDLYALGWGVSHLRGQKMVSHSGGINGFSSKLTFFPDRKWGLAILTNADGNGYDAVQTIVSRLIEDFLDVKPDERKDVIAQLDKILQDRVKQYFGTRDRLYPQLPEPPLPLAGHLSEYAGSYYHPAYRTLHLKVAKPPKDKPIAQDTKAVLHADVRRLVDFTLDVEHVSGQFFIAWTDTETTNFGYKAGVKAMFTLGSGGSVEKWGVDIEGSGRLVWFIKVD